MENEQKEEVLEVKNDKMDSLLKIFVPDNATEVSEKEKSDENIEKVLEEPKDKKFKLLELDTNIEIKPKENKALEKEAEAEIDLKRYRDALKWGHNKNRVLVETKKKISEFLEKKKEEGLIEEEEIEEIKGLFSKELDEDFLPEPIVKNVDMKSERALNIKEKLDKEFKLYKKYNKDPNLDDIYDSFFEYGWAFEKPEEQEKLLDYFESFFEKERSNEEDGPEAIIDYIIDSSQKLYGKVYSKIRKSGGVMEYILDADEEMAKLQSKIEKLEAKLKNSAEEIEPVKKPAYAKSINSRQSYLETQKTENASENLDDFYFRILNSK